jgi:hypothetical protein
MLKMFSYLVCTGWYSGWRSQGVALKILAAISDIEKYLDKDASELWNQATWFVRR